MCEFFNCVCDICANNYKGKGCSEDYSDYGDESLRWPQDCDGFELSEEDEGDTKIYESEPELVCKCPCCGSDAYYDGLEYECSNDSCGWVGSDENDF